MIASVIGTRDSIVSRTDFFLQWSLHSSKEDSK